MELSPQGSEGFYVEGAKVAADLHGQRQTNDGNDGIGDDNGKGHALTNFNLADQVPGQDDEDHRAFDENLQSDNHFNQVAGD